MVYCRICQGQVFNAPATYYSLTLVEKLQCVKDQCWPRDGSLQADEVTVATSKWIVLDRGKMRGEGGRFPMGILPCGKQAICFIPRRLIVFLSGVLCALAGLQPECSQALACYRESRELCAVISRLCSCSPPATKYCIWLQHIVEPATAGGRKTWPAFT